MKTSLWLLLCGLVPLIAGAQPEDKNSSRLSSKELSIPTSPVFDLLGVAPSQVARTSDIKDFKVDWSFKSWKLNPNLAIQGQPIWEIFYNRKRLEKYQQASAFSRMLASIDVSLGTVQNENNDRRIGGAVKINLYKERDPLMRKDFYNDVEQLYDNELASLKLREKKLLRSIDTITAVAALNEAREALQRNDEQVQSFHNRRNAAIREKAAAFISNNWNSAFVDFAYGQVYTYATDSTGSLGKLRLNRNTGKGLWLNFGCGIGKRILISGLIRNTFYEDEVGFTLRDSVSSTDTSVSLFAGNNIISAGLNIRYGTPIYNFFVEFFYETKTTTTSDDAVRNNFTPPAGQEIVGGSTRWDIVTPYSYSIGGDWRISRNLMINYSIRCMMDKEFRTTAVIPVASISCMMR
jgi:hypothetical protein